MVLEIDMEIMRENRYTHKKNTNLQIDTEQWENTD
jgi:hypothetical protein